MLLFVAHTGNCAELQAAAEATATVGNVVGQLVEEEIFCDEW